MKKAYNIGLIIMLFILTNHVFAQMEKKPMVIKNITQLEWHPKKTLPPGAMSATAVGDPTTGHYDFYGKFPANYTVPMHWHSFDCTVIIIKGSMTIKRKGLPDNIISAGGLFTLTGKMEYIAYTPVECIFLVHGESPFDITYVNPADDPRKP